MNVKAASGLLLVSLSSMFLTACTTMSSIAKATASFDFNCPETTVYVRNVAGDNYLAQGCGKTAVYTCAETSHAAIGYNSSCWLNKRSPDTTTVSSMAEAASVPTATPSPSQVSAVVASTPMPSSTPPTTLESPTPLFNGTATNSPSLLFAGVNLGGAFDLNNPPHNPIYFDYGVRVGARVGHIGESVLALVLSFDRFSTSASGNATVDGKTYANAEASEAYHDTCFQVLATQIGGSGFYIGPNLGMANLKLTIDADDKNISTLNTFFVEMGVATGYEFYLNDRFSVGPDVRLEHIFATSADGNAFKFTLGGNVHF